MLQVMQVVTNARVSGLRSGVTLRQGAARQLGCGILCHCFKKGDFKISCRGHNATPR
ncbi:hypothetical protein RR11_2145 [Ruegeria sp. R11]|nr:hypothetical protein RR11_2145 [Ruegeria sp. R11]